MKKYKGYYIDGVIFHNEKEIDLFRESLALSAYKRAVELFAIDSCRSMELSMLIDEKAEYLINHFDYTWEQLEDIEIEILSTTF